MQKYALLLLAFLLFSFSGISLKKRISDADFRYEFYTTDKVAKPKDNRQYYWFKGGAIHNSEYGTAGELLHDEFLKFYHSNQLAEGGVFKKGLKNGYWKSWFENGKLQSKIYWKDGQKDGSGLWYDTAGNLIEKGRYKNNRKYGMWINYITGDTLKYRKGELKIKKIKDTLKENKPRLFKRMFSRKKDTILSNQDLKGKIQLPEQKKAQKPEVRQKPQQEKKEKEGNFFSRIFNKKDKTKEENVKGK